MKDFFPALQSVVLFVDMKFELDRDYHALGEVRYDECYAYYKKVKAILPDVSFTIDLSRLTGRDDSKYSGFVQSVKDVFGHIDDKNSLVLPHGKSEFVSLQTHWASLYDEREDKIQQITAIEFQHPALRRNLWDEIWGNWTETDDGEGCDCDSDDEAMLFEDPNLEEIAEWRFEEWRVANPELYRHEEQRRAAGFAADYDDYLWV